MMAFFAQVCFVLVPTSTVKAQGKQLELYLLHWCWREFYVSLVDERIKHEVHECMCPYKGWGVYRHQSLIKTKYSKEAVTPSTYREAYLTTFCLGSLWEDCAAVLYLANSFCRDLASDRSNFIKQKILCSASHGKKVK